MSWAPRARTWKSPRSKRRGSACSPTAHREPLPRVELGWRPYKGQMSAGPRGVVSSARLERALPATSTPCLLPLGYEDERAATRGRTGPSAVRRRSRKPCAAAKLAILASNQETPGSEPGGSAEFPQWPSGTGEASRTRKPRGLSSRGLPDCRHSRVRRQGIEPRSAG
jgi:hypothetical protein